MKVYYGWQRPNKIAKCEALAPKFGMIFRTKQ
jgi:hypothetical protein